jgi:RsiW-degrading membrane proteinase PrsW (M82 family)
MTEIELQRAPSLSENSLQLGKEMNDDMVMESLPHVITFQQINAPPPTPMVIAATRPAIVAEPVHVPHLIRSSPNQFNFANCVFALLFVIFLIFFVMAIFIAESDDSLNSVLLIVVLCICGVACILLCVGLCYLCAWREPEPILPWA